MLKIAEIVPEKDVVYDVGCMDGRIVIRAVEKPFKVAKIWTPIGDDKDNFYPRRLYLYRIDSI